ncbi:NIPSNAP family protein [Gramella sp. AN32]|uniref:NIPSNAP family protein n=1 Tax=Christiangramia antarctica TaxID=2058158 RepID=A0ABW5X6K4_9FLAO|nr:NIPSNAP family protein [Gramella sp. AN32]MCM4156384.1 NIPSNAP family containing protein [Gramella sp. AN32]
MNSKIIFFICSLFLYMSSLAQSEIYELRVYDMKFGVSEATLHDYFKDALIPALNREGLNKVGAFEESGESLPKKIYLLIPYESMQAYAEINDKIEQDGKFLSDSEAFSNLPVDKIPFERYESRLIRSTWGFPNLVKPDDALNQFELRIYESSNEDALRRKLKMFNENEFEIFENVGLHTVFFGKNISGGQMPSLTYMLAFKDKAEHEKAWAGFGKNPEWKRISKLDEYTNTVSDITRVFLKTLPYSQL